MLLSTNKKPSRAEAFAALLTLKQLAGDNDTPEIDRLINYFAPSVPKSPKTSFEWVARAVADDREVRKYLRFVHVSEGHAVATNGYILHRAPSDLADGYYCPRSGLPVECDMRYPDVRRVIPRDGSLPEYDGRDWPREAHTVQGREIFVGVFADILRINEKYLNMALASEATELYHDGLVLMGRNRFGQFVIQGMRL